MQMLHEGSVLSPAGFEAGASKCGIKSAKGGPDVALIVSKTPAAAAGVFTTNQFAAAPVKWSRQILPSEKLRAVVVNSGNANACTGPQGDADVVAAAQHVADMLGCAPDQVVVASTGIVGHPLPTDKLHAGIESAHAALSGTTDAARQTEMAIMTTDTRPKACAVRACVGEREFCVGGMAKGAGMIAPHMATLLVFVTTDAQVPLAALESALRSATEISFNSITIDGDCSTNDSVLLLANGASGAVVSEGDVSEQQFRAALTEVMQNLAIQVVRDGEGATKLIEVHVTGGLAETEARKVARAIATSLLVKCAIHGGDPNWGRIVCAAGYSGAEFDPDSVVLQIGGKTVFRRGAPTGEDASDEVGGEEVHICLDLGRGDAAATVWTCDLSKEYVDINALYHT